MDSTIGLQRVTTLSRRTNPRNFIRNGKAVGELQGYACDIVVDESHFVAGEACQERSTFFLNLWFHEPHAPLAAPAEIVKRRRCVQPS